jgi:hypothetical protein
MWQIKEVDEVLIQNFDTGGAAIMKEATAFLDVSPHFAAVRLTIRTKSQADKIADQYAMWRLPAGFRLPTHLASMSTRAAPVRVKRFALRHSRRAIDEWVAHEPYAAR